MNVVTRSLFRTHRLPLLVFLGLISVTTVVITTVTAALDEVRFSWWLLVGASSVRWYLLLTGVMLIAVHLRLYVANGVTRRAFLAGAAVFGTLTAFGLSAVVVLGRGLERLLWGLGTVPAQYPEFTPAEILRELGHVLPGALGGLVTGALVTAAFYRSARGGLALLVPGLLPLAAAESLLGLYTDGAPNPRLLPFVPGLLISLALIAGGAALLRPLVRDVAIRPSAG